MSVTIRPEEPRDIDHVRVVNERAFESPDEAALVDALRATPGALSLVAADGDRIVGHILFTPVQIESRAMAIRAVGLAPMAVLPEYQRRGIGSELVRRGLDMCRASGQEAVVVVGHPTFYPRFGFVPAFTKDLDCEFTVPRDVFMVLELRAGALASAHGVVRYRPEFGP